MNRSNGSARWCWRTSEPSDFPVVAGLYMPAFKSAEEFAKGLALVRKRGGHGVSLFGGVSEEMWNVFEKGIEAWK